MTESDPCPLCSDPRREPDVVCVVASPSDLIAIDRGGHFRGRYHVLHGLLSPLEGVGPDDLRIAELVRRLGPGEAGGVAEVIIATSPSVEGEATAMYLARLIKPLGVRVSRIATGLPVGGELEYTDQATIARALAHRAAL
jgi:recombination protein RecR